jgi:hypothetical protein
MTSPPARRVCAGDPRGRSYHGSLPQHHDRMPLPGLAWGLLCIYGPMPPASHSLAPPALARLVGAAPAGAVIGA